MAPLATAVLGPAVPKRSPGRRAGGDSSPVKKVTFFRNGDRHFKGRKVVVDRRRYREWESLLVELSHRVGPQAIASVHDSATREIVLDIAELRDGHSYVCVTQSDRLKGDTRYSTRHSRQWANAQRVDNGPDDLPPLRSSPRAGRRRPLIPALPALNAPLTKAKVLNIFKKSSVHGRPAKYVVHPRATPDIEQVLDALSRLVFVSGGVRKLYTRNGRRLRSVEDLLGPNVTDVVACGGSERFFGDAGRKRKFKARAAQDQSRSLPTASSLPPILHGRDDPALGTSPEGAVVDHQVSSMSAPVADYYDSDAAGPWAVGGGGGVARRRSRASRRPSTPRPGEFTASGNLAALPVISDSPGQQLDGSILQATSEAVPLSRAEAAAGTESDNHVDQLVSRAHAVETLQSREKVRQARGQVRRMGERAGQRHLQQQQQQRGGKAPRGIEAPAKKQHPRRQQQQQRQPDVQQQQGVLLSQVETEQAELHRKLESERERQVSVLASKMARRRVAAKANDGPTLPLVEDVAEPTFVLAKIVRAVAAPSKARRYTAIDEFAVRMIQQWFRKARQSRRRREEVEAELRHKRERAKELVAAEAEAEAAAAEEEEHQEQQGSHGDTAPPAVPAQSGLRAEAEARRPTPPAQPKPRAQRPSRQKRPLAPAAEAPTAAINANADVSATPAAAPANTQVMPPPVTRVDPRAETPDLAVSRSMVELVQRSAATKIQTKWRSFRARKGFTDRRRAAVRIQSAFRGYRTRKDVGRAVPRRRPNNSKGPAAAQGSKGPQQRRRKRRSGGAAAPGASKSSPRSSTLSRFGIVGVPFIEARYELFEVLGDGNFAVVRRSVERATGREVAIKVIDKLKLKNVKESTMVQKEVETMRLVDHPNCVKLEEVFETPDHIYLVLELVRGGDLFDRVVAKGKYTEADARHLIKSMATAIHYLHAHNIVHRDLKPENCLVMQDAAGKDVIKLADFGLSLVISEPLYTICGTPTYVAPEIISDKAEGYGLEVDMWAIGVIGYILLCGFPPFASSTKSQQDLFAKIKGGRYSFPNPYWQDVSDSAKDLISRLLRVDKAKRYTAAQVLQHPFITGNAASHADRHDNVANELLKHFPAKSKWKAAVTKISAAKAFAQKH